MSLRLVDAELRRFWSRRAVRWLLALCLLLALIVNGVQFARSSISTTYRPGDVFGELPDACRLGERDGVPVVDLRCAERAGLGLGVHGGGGAPVPGTVLFEDVDDRRVRVGRTFEGTVGGLGIALTMLGVLFGATFLTAEFGSAGLSTQLLFEPRRVRLYLAKVTALFVGCAVCAVIVVAWVGLGQVGASATRGTTSGVDSVWLVERLADTGRVAASSGLAGACAVAVGVLARRTVVAVGVFFGLVIATGFLSGVSWGEPIGRVSPMNTLFAMAVDDFAEAEAFIGLRTLAGAVALSVAWVVGLSVVGAWWFARREVR
jgi:ABC-2 type transport system permease protein